MSSRNDEDHFDTQGRTIREVATRYDWLDEYTQFRKKPNRRQLREINRLYPPVCVESEREIPPHYPPFASASCTFSMDLTKNQLLDFFFELEWRWIDFIGANHSHHVADSMDCNVTHFKKWPTKPHPTQHRRSVAENRTYYTYFPRRSRLLPWHNGIKGSKRSVLPSASTNRQKKRQMLLDL